MSAGQTKVCVVSDAAGYNLSRLKPESSWAPIQAEPILPASTST